MGKRTVEEVRAPVAGAAAAGAVVAPRGAGVGGTRPEAIVVPSGNRIRLVYEPGRPPVLAVRMQELSAWRDAAWEAGVPVLLHLLGPNFRPVQVTDDLASFWASTYFQVRKDSSRYPCYAWPDDPRTAHAEAKGGRRTCRTCIYEEGRGKTEKKEGKGKTTQAGSGGVRRLGVQTHHVPLVILPLCLFFLAYRVLGYSILVTKAGRLMETIVKVVTIVASIIERGYSESGTRRGTADATLEARK